MTMFDLTPFTDEDLDRRRTTRMATDPVMDARDSLVAGDLLLVDTTAYGVDGHKWCRFVRTAPGSASVYPYKVQIPERGIGQYAAREIEAWARPMDIHLLMRICRLETPNRELAAVRSASSGEVVEVPSGTYTERLWRA